ncbi:MAG: TlpA family protein disulfide reductase [Salinivirgaceae bacterium]
MIKQTTRLISGIALLSLLVFTIQACQNGTKKQEKVYTNTENEDSRKPFVETRLKGTLYHADDSRVVVSAPGISDTVEANSQNQFEFVFNLNRGGYFVIHNSGKNLRVYLSPGDKLELSFDAGSVYESLTLDGAGSLENTFLKQKYQLLLEHAFSGSHAYEIQPKAFRYLVDSLYVVEKIYLADFVEQHPGINPDFVEREQAALLYDWANKLMEYPRLNQVNATIDNDTYFKFLNKISVNEPRYLDIYEYRMFLNSYIAHYAHQQMQASGKWNLETHEVSLIRMQQVNRLISDARVKDYLLASVIKEQVNYFGYKNTETLFQIFEMNCSDPLLKQEVLAPYQNYLALKQHAMAPEVKLIDAQGKQFTLADFAGSYIYIDVWATWCLPCKKEAPYFEDLRQKYAHKNITFIAISVDEKQDEWREYLTVRPTKYPQFWAFDAKQFLNDYSIKTIPHFIIIGPDGKIVNPNAFRPSEPDLPWFESLPGKRAV